MDQHPRPDPTDDLRTVAGHDTPTGWGARLLALIGPVVIWATGVRLAAGAVPSTVGPGQCEGLGFGCQFSPHDGVLFLGGFLGLFIVPVTTLVAILVGTRGPVPDRLSRVIVVLVLLAVGVAVFGVWQVSAPPNL